MADVLSYWPNDTLAYRQFYRDSVWSSAVGESIFHGAPSMVAKTSMGEVIYDFEDFFDYSTSNYTDSDFDGGTPYNGGTAALSTTMPNGVLTLASSTGSIDTGIQRNFSFKITEGDTQTIWHETQLSLDSGSVGEMFVGLATQEAGDDAAMPILHPPYSYFAFYKNADTNVITSRIAPITGLVAQHAGGINNNYPLQAGVMTRFGIIIRSTTDGVVSEFYINGVPHTAFSIPWGDGFSEGVLLQWVCSIAGYSATSTAETANIDYHHTLQGPP